MPGASARHDEQVVGAPAARRTLPARPPPFPPPPVELAADPAPTARSVRAHRELGAGSLGSMAASPGAHPRCAGGNQDLRPPPARSPLFSVFDAKPPWLREGRAGGPPPRRRPAKSNLSDPHGCGSRDSSGESSSRASTGTDSSPRFAVDARPVRPRQGPRRRFPDAENPATPANPRGPTRLAP
jgi:hypothetical protein